jgi:hypothetical protein
VPDVFDASFGAKGFLGCFQGGVGGAVSPSDADEPESNKSRARAKAGVVSLPHAKVEDIHFLEILTPTGEVFLAMPSPDDCATNLFLDFKGLARASSHAEV